MKYVKILFAIALVFTMCSAFSLKKDHSKPVYAFGISASFTDTVVYFTEIQILEKALLILFSEPTWFNGRRTIRDCSANACRIDWRIHHTA
jgi:hypothetical protein